MNTAAMIARLTMISKQLPQSLSGEAVEGGGISTLVEGPNMTANGQEPSQIKLAASGTNITFVRKKLDGEENGRRRVRELYVKELAIFDATEGCESCANLA